MLSFPNRVRVQDFLFVESLINVISEIFKIEVHPLHLSSSIDCYLPTQAQLHHLFHQCGGECGEQLEQPTALYPTLPSGFFDRMVRGCTCDSSVTEPGESEIWFLSNDLCVCSQRLS